MEKNYNIDNKNTILISNVDEIASKASIYEVLASHAGNKKVVFN